MRDFVRCSASSPACCSADAAPGLTPEGETLGTPIAVLVRNKDQRSGDYSEMDVRGCCPPPAALCSRLTLPRAGGLPAQPRGRHLRHEVRRARSGGAPP